MPFVFDRFGPMFPAPIAGANSWRQGTLDVPNETPIGAIDGVNKVYTLVTAAPNPRSSLMLFADGNLCTLDGPSADPSGNPMYSYSLSGMVITFDNPLPSSVVTLRAFYRYKVGG